jgi:alkylhydroperoxidase family enzyme
MQRISGGMNSLPGWHGSQRGQGDGPRSRPVPAGTRIRGLARREDPAWKKCGRERAGHGAQAGLSDNPKTAAALAFALKLVEHRGQMAGADIEALRAAGFDDGQIVEIIAHVALNVFTNYVNIALDVPVDFPGVKFPRAA